MTLILHNITMHTCIPYIIHGCDLIQVKDTNLAFWTTTLVIFLTSWIMCFVIFQPAPSYQCFWGTNWGLKNLNKIWKSSWFFIDLPLFKRDWKQWQIEQVFIYLFCTSWPRLSYCPKQLLSTTKHKQFHFFHGHILNL